MNKEEAIKFISYSYQEAWIEYSKVFNLPAKAPELIIKDLGKRIAGCSYRQSYKVELNPYFCMVEGTAFLRTIYHELAHIIQYRIFPYAKQAHGPEFRHIMQAIGEDYSTYHNYDVRKVKDLRKTEKVLIVDSISADEM